MNWLSQNGPTLTQGERAARQHTSVIDRQAVYRTERMFRIISSMQICCHIHCPANGFYI